VYGGMVAQMFASSLQRTSVELERAGCPTIWLSNRLSNVRLARNELTAAFLTMPDLTHAMWIDADISWEPSDVLKLLAHDLDVVAGAYCKKAYPLELAMYLATNELGLTRQKPSGLLEADFVGAGFMLVKREVYLRLIAACPERATPQAAPGWWPALAPWLYDLYPDGIEAGEVYGEDVGFCRLWRSIGGEIWIDPSIQLAHHGMHAFADDPMNLLIPSPIDAAAA
jgi:hypothetical protein